MKEENNTEGLYFLKIDARRYFPGGNIPGDVLEALQCRRYAEALAFYLEQSRKEDWEVETATANVRGRCEGISQLSGSICYGLCYIYVAPTY